MASPPTRRLRADAERNRAQLLKAARTAFARHGVTASLDEVARAAGVGAGTLYRHFPTRDHLVAAVIDDGLLALRDQAHELANAADPVEALRTWLESYIDQGNVFRGLATTLLNVPDDGAENVACRQARDAGAALVQRAVSTGALSPTTRPEDVLDMAAAIAWVADQPNRDDEQRGRLVGILVDGLRTPARP